MLILWLNEFRILRCNLSFRWLCAARIKIRVSNQLLRQNIISINRTRKRSFDNIVVTADNSLVGVLKTNDNSSSDKCEYIDLFKCTASGELPGRK